MEPIYLKKIMEKPGVYDIEISYFSGMWTAKLFDLVEGEVVLKGHGASPALAISSLDSRVLESGMTK